MEERQVTAVTRMMNAVNAGDPKSYASLYGQDAVITIYGSGEFKGRDAIERYEAELLRAFPGARLAFYAIWQKGPLAVVHYTVNGQTPGGQSMGHQGLLFYRFHDSGLIEEERRYLDSLTPLAQMGMLGELPARPPPTLPTQLKAHVAKGSPDENENVATVTASLAALNSKNGAALLATLAEDAVLDELVVPHPFLGKENLKACFENWTRAVPDANSEISTILGVGEFVLVETVVRGTLRGPFGRLVASSKPFTVHHAAIVHVKDGKITRVSGFMNGKELAEAVGQWTPPETPGQSSKR
jgi:steroid delta-isomerase-like uncharacterized protein